MAKKVLAANAREAWLTAVSYCEKILNGYVTLQTKKLFVESLHNAAELILKQIMIDQNNHDVVAFRANSINTVTIDKIKEFLDADNLNSYLSSITYSITAFGKSIDFTKIIDFVKPSKLFKAPIIFDDISNWSKWIADLKKSLGALNVLRNDATHFSIDASDFLTTPEFYLMIKMLKQFYIIISSKEYDPIEIAEATGDEYWVVEIPAYLPSVIESSDESKDFGTFICDNQLNKSIAKVLQGEFYEWQANNYYAIKDFTDNDFPDFETDTGIPSAEIVGRIQMMISNGILKLREERVTDVNSQSYESTEIYFEFDSRLLSDEDKR
jgi:hypothetical protein